MISLFEKPLSVINVGLESFALNIEHAAGSVTALDWQPPLEGDRDAGLMLAQALADRRIDRANAEALSRFQLANPVLSDVRRADEVICAMRGARLLLHAGPPIAWKDMCGPMQGALCGAAVLEGWAKDVHEAAEALAAGNIALAPNHHHGAVGPMAGVISPSMPVWVVEESTFGGRAISNLNEGLGQVLRFGANSDEVLKRLAWMRDELAPALKAALALTGPIELKPLIAQALLMGDECHNRNAAATGLLIKRLAAALATHPAGSPALNFMAGNDHFFLNVSMAACKAMLDAARNVAHSSFVTVMARNGVNFGIQLSGTGDSWFQAPANKVDGLFFAGFSLEDAAADLGDSAITETAGIGGFAMAAAPAIVKFVGGTPADATEQSVKMKRITLAESPIFTLPALNFAGAGSGIDARLVLEAQILPVINTGIAHKAAGVGQIGAGITTAPEACFRAALAELLAQR